MRKLINKLFQRRYLIEFKGDHVAVCDEPNCDYVVEAQIKEVHTLPHSTITASLTYDLGRNRQLSFGSIQTPNEMLYIYIRGRQYGCKKNN